MADAYLALPNHCHHLLRDLGHQWLIADTVSANLLMTLTGYRTSLTSSYSERFPHSERFSADVSRLFWICTKRILIDISFHNYICIQ